MIYIALFGHYGDCVCYPDDIYFTSKKAIEKSLRIQGLKKKKNDCAFINDTDRTWVRVHTLAKEERK